MVIGSVARVCPCPATVIELIFGWMNFVSFKFYFNQADIEIHIPLGRVPACLDLRSCRCCSHRMRVACSFRSAKFKHFYVPWCAWLYWKYWNTVSGWELASDPAGIFCGCPLDPLGQPTPRDPNPTVSHVPSAPPRAFGAHGRKSSVNFGGQDILPENICMTN